MTDAEYSFCWCMFGGLRTEPLLYLHSPVLQRSQQMSSRNLGFVIKSTTVGEKKKIGALKVLEQIFDWNSHKWSEIERP